MYTTEAEARQKQCPMTFNNHAGSSANCFACIASKCMAWRWKMGLFCLDKERFLNPDESTTEPRSEVRPTDRGYCGLVGLQE